MKIFLTHFDQFSWKWAKHLRKFVILTHCAIDSISSNSKNYLNMKMQIFFTNYVHSDSGRKS